MPELAEVEIVRQNLTRWWARRAAEVVELPDPEVVTDSEPERVLELLQTPPHSIERRGKFLWAAYEDASALLFHFRMTGKITRQDERDARFVRAAWHVPASGWLLFKDARRLGHITAFAPHCIQEHPPIAQMGPEPHDLTTELLANALSGTRRTLKSALLDQTVVAGVGNIAISELFWRLRLRPEVRCDELSEEALEALVVEMPRFFDWLVKDQQGDEIVYLGEGKPRNPFTAYKRQGEPCPRCQTPLERTRVASRSSYFCPQCQD